MKTAPVILLAGCWDEGDGYPRVDTLRAALHACGLGVVERCVPAPFCGRRKQRLAAQPWRWPTLAAALPGLRRCLQRAVRAAVREHAPAAVLVPYPGHLVVRWVRDVFEGPVVLDLFLSAHDTVVVDRQRFRPRSVPARLLARLDRRACAAADLVLLDTAAHAEHVMGRVGLPAERFDWVPIADPAPPGRPTPLPERRSGEPLEVLFFGTGVPLHGLTHLVEAVRSSDGVRLTLVGGSPADRSAAAQALGPRLRLGAPFEARGQLDQRLRDCHLVAGIFGAGAKAQLVVPYKVVQALAAGRPVLTGDTEAVRAVLQPGRDCVVCAPGDAAAIASELRRLARSPVRLAELAEAARSAYERAFGLQARAGRLAAALAGLGVAVPPQPSPAAAPEVMACGR